MLEEDKIIVNFTVKDMLFLLERNGVLSDCELQTDIINRIRVGFANLLNKSAADAVADWYQRNEVSDE